MKNISIITIANNKEVYNSFVDNLLKQKNVNAQLLTVYNYNNTFKSAVEAYNSILKEVKYSLIIFCHPDIRFLDNNSLLNIVEQVEQLNDYGVVGIAGASASEIYKSKPIVYTSIIQGVRRQHIGVQISSPMIVQTLDECFFLTSRSNLESIRLSEIKGTECIKEKWHLYCVNYCLKMIKNGKNNYVLPSRVWHLSDGHGGNWVDYMLILEKLIYNEKNNFDIIYTTIKAWKTSGILSYAYRKYYIIKQFFRNIIYG